ncbi:MAG: hypothetical protein M3R17_13860 [Bacteroidota bacterium]|nr:hypothetical protein [Bacteroidota bacterium]
MKKFSLLACAFFLMTFQVNARIKESVFCSNTDCWRINSPQLGFSFYFQPAFVRSIVLQKKALPLFIPQKQVIYIAFAPMQYEFPKGAVFCRMENNFSKRFGFMLSIHAGGYSER